MKFRLIILILENHSIEKLQLSTFISPPRLQVTSNLIQNLRPWQSASSAQTGLNGRKQSRQNCTRSRNERYSHRLYLLLETFFLWDQNGFSSVKGMKTMRW